ncbi:ribosome biogenesis GTP-binding protein YihA/YsxC [Haliangium ochraceum]|uniref:Probable GTP-binding protein EngB n=1 Tax=Haliangium ochraceum (strain DSM 14365 / JCM 11303 / SMP-2) TaxID=502025 RepID=D0LG49_HALO1|nr:ribosome biogenesis GTP-binding protein YihA/YsxC [Haliangium ochraceum]ACY18074.1 ribosome biogenesis GTP-binding protein YsxC [Haliangium ochraceum DSM 14365]
MKPKSAEFVTSAAKPSQFPAPTLPEIAFAGRSNVGKSSLINTLVDIAGLARTSRTPGRTRLVNWFQIVPAKGKPMLFVDLPGYGYAKVPTAMRASWRPLIEDYLSDRATLRALVVLIDARRGAQEEEIDLLDWLRSAEVPAITVVTKADKLSKNKRKPAAAEIQRDLGLRRPPILFSSLSGDGLNDLWQAIARKVSAR